MTEQKSGKWTPKTGFIPDDPQRVCGFLEYECPPLESEMMELGPMTITHWGETSISMSCQMRPRGGE